MLTHVKTQTSGMVLASTERLTSSAEQQRRACQARSYSRVRQDPRLSQMAGGPRCKA